MMNVVAGADMNIRSLIFFSLALLCSPSNAQTQLEMNKSACGEYQESDKKLNILYQQVIEQHKADTLFTEKMRNAQRAWLAFREAELEAIYPADDKRFEYGSVYPMCSCAEKTALTNRRIEQLSKWLTAQEGDVCSGSR